MSVSYKEILIIDDDAEMRLLLRKILEGVGAKVIEKDRVETALEHALVHPPHLILLDMKLPSHSGLTFLKARNKNRVLQSVPVIVISATKDESSIYQAISLGASDYLVKPLQTKTILQKVRKYLKDNAFLGYKFAPSERPQAQLSLMGHITAFNRTYFKLEAPIKIEKNTTINVKSSILSRIGAKDLPLKTNNYPASYLEEKRYLNTVQIIGASEEEIKLIKEAVKKFA